MLDSGYDRINEYRAVKISLASPADIRSWSYGEVTEPETINYRTYRPERDGLFCERIFGPERDWECSCGKYRGMKHKGIVCDRCGVKVTHSRVRRHRMGHINLAAPVVHIWFFKSMPCRLANLLAMKSSDLQRIIYFQNFAVTDPKDTPLEYRQLLTEEEYREAQHEYGERGFEARMGAECIKRFLEDLDLDTLCVELRAELKTCSSKQRYKKIIKQLTEAEALRDSQNRPEWIVLDVIPVIPPDLRPLVLLESGNFASSDLNDLYRRIINRNNRLKKLLNLNAPDVIIRNEKRMLQQAVDALFDNNRCKRPVMGSSNRPLKSLTDMIKGKQGRFRENLLGKRVDYSARSVIVVGPELKLHQCGLPKKIGLELYQPFIIRKLKDKGVADTLKNAKKELERRTDEVWDVLDEVIERHPVLLNRAPTLHRMGIQAFDPVLVEGNAIKLHPLVCKGFNADFDGDAMAVHLPLSVEAQIEAKTLMMAPHNVFTPQSGRPIIGPSHDIVLGCFYLTVEPRDEQGEPKCFSSFDEVHMAHGQGRLNVHSRVRVRARGVEEVVEKDDGPPKPLEGLLETTVGRIIFNDILPEGLPFYNCRLASVGLNRVIHDCYERLGRQKTVEMLDDTKDLGFHAATEAGISFSMEDLKLPPNKERILKDTEKLIKRITTAYREGAITDIERRQRVIDEWNAATDAVAKEMFDELANDEREGQPYLNPVYLMMESGARGKSLQVSQLAGMRGLMAKPSGQIIETPIKANFREGLDVLEYFSSTHGARKGLADTALKTAESGYLTRRLADVAQNVIVSMRDCGTANGITKGPVMRGDRIAVPLRDIVTGRVARDNIVDLVNDEVIVRENELVTEQIARRIEELDERMKIRVRSPLTCEAPEGVCAMCYGMDLARKELAERGLTAGIIAAQSIGEPGTQLTMRTFHIGGVAIGGTEESEIFAKRGGEVKFEDLEVVQDPDRRRVSISRHGQIVVADEKGRELDRHNVPLGAEVLVEQGQSVKDRQKIVQWDVHFTPILAEVSGKVRYEDIAEGKTLKIERDEAHGTSRRVIMEHKGDMHPQILIEGSGGDILSLYPLPEKAIVEVENGQKIKAGIRLARTLREVQRTQDITGGLPRVTELFEARTPKEPAVISEIDGVVTDIERKRGRTVIKVEDPETDYQSEHTVPAGKHLRVNRGDKVTAGQPLVDGPLVLDDILRISGEEALHNYMLQEIQNVYRTQDATIDDKHFEIIIAQMTRRVKVNESGDTHFLPDELVDKFGFRRINQEVIEQGGEPAQAEPVLLGITKAALSSDSFISAASFQNTTRVLTQAALAGKVDTLKGLKENVILGHLIPSGTGFPEFYQSQVRRLAPSAPLRELEAPAETS
ncbi:MAG: DNA-directed RNA polymerase subunit beta' [Planctomycetes bacterium SM23_32]|nr:MAG: DNA-directed RNA polymerase subunit beta' [Planctomycetes bacterium SM23_32]